jgi:hypothetical protein
VLEQALGERIDHFAYPGGQFNPQVVSAAAAGYRYAYGLPSGDPSHPALTLERLLLWRLVHRGRWPVLVGIVQLPDTPCGRPRGARTDASRMSAFSFSRDGIAKPAFPWSDASASRHRSSSVLLVRVRQAGSAPTSSCSSSADALQARAVRDGQRHAASSGVLRRLVHISPIR